jgi:hypothetical protein
MQPHMKKLYYMLVVTALLLSVVRAEAEFTEADDELCVNNCGQANTACVARIDLPNDVEVQDAKAACQVALDACYTVCEQKKNAAKFGDSPPEEQQIDKPEN